MSTDQGTSPWHDRHLWNIQPVRDVMLGAAIFGILYLGSVLSLVTVPLLLALLLAYLFEPIIGWLHARLKVSRQVAAGLVVAVTAFAVIVPLLVGVSYASWQGISLARSVTQNATQLSEVVASNDTGPTIDDLPARGGWRTLARELLEMRKHADQSEALKMQLDAQKQIASEDSELPADPTAPRSENEEQPDSTPEPIDFEDTDASDQPIAVTQADLDRAERAEFLLDIYARTSAWFEEHAGQIGRRAVNATGDALSAAFSTAKAIGITGFQAFLTAFFFFFLSSSYGGVRSLGVRLIPSDRRERTADLVQQMDRVIAGFVRGRLTIAGIQCVFFVLGYFIIGTPAPLILGVAVGVLSIVPYLALVSIPVSVLLMALESSTGLRGEWWWIVFAPIVVYQLGQMLDDYVLTPWIQGKSTDLDTPTVLFASIAGGILAGVYGLLIAIPIAACIKILIREVLMPRYMEWVAGDRADPLPVGSGASAESEKRSESDPL